jgi:threonine dehydrogenase-like Zn-dependent dehydrogenase
VAEVGAGLSNDLIGQRFVSNSVVPCGHCRRCRRGDTHLCAERQIFGMHRAGAFAEYVNVPLDALIPWSESLPAAAACLAEPLGNGVHVVNLTRHLAADTVLVIGAGPIGLMCQQALQVLRGSRTMVSDLAPGRLAIAARLGAEETVCTGEQDVATAALDWTQGEGVDLVVDAAGSAASKRLSLAALRPGGAAVWIGLHGDRMDLDTYQVTIPEKQILGTYAAKRPELQQALDLMEQGKVDVTSWTETAPLDDAVAVFRRMLQPAATDIKAIFLP